MGKVLQPRKHRHKRHYTFMIISGDSDRKSKQIHLGHVATQVLAFSLFAILVAIVCYIAYITLRFKNLQSSNSQTLSSMQAVIDNQQQMISDLSAQNSSLQTANSELQAGYEQVSKALNIMVDDEEANEAAQIEADNNFITDAAEETEPPDDDEEENDSDSSTIADNIEQKAYNLEKIT
jgi:septal ring factor EnvC (AmiA/AmiB activator)